MEQIKRIHLSDIADLITKGTTPTTLGYEFIDSGVNFLKIECFNENGCFLPEKVAHISEEGNEKLKRSQLKAGDILFSIAGAIGRVAIVEEQMLPANTNQALAIIRISNDEVYLPYVKLILTSDYVKQQLEKKQQGVAQLNLSLKDIGALEIPLPSRGKQKEYAELFYKVSDVIADRRQEIELLDNLIKARFVEMFGDININDKGWDIQPLGELCTIVRGGSPRPIENFLGGNVPWIKIGDATDGESIYLNSTKEHIIQEGVKKSRLVKTGSLIFANCGVSLGFARIITFDGCIHDGWLAMEDIDERLDKVFLLQALNQMTEHFRAIAPAGTQPNLNTAIMKAYKQIIPPMELQQEFLAFAKQVDKSKFAVQKALDEAQLLFDSLMQEYFG